jgi:mannose-6-phosphate isomerase-like protein (cupin superfamily)
LTVGDRTEDLVAGDSAYFPADQPHRYVNPGHARCEYYVAALIMRSRRAATRTTVARAELSPSLAR